jgi:hypothetical protein
VHTVSHEAAGSREEDEEMGFGTLSSAAVRLTAYNTGFTEEADFDAWVAYVTEHIEEAVGFPVEVDSFAFTGRNAGGARDEVTGATDEQAEAIRDALSNSLWEQACADNFDQPRVETA